MTCDGCVHKEACTRAWNCAYSRVPVHPCPLHSKLKAIINNSCHICEHAPAVYHDRAGRWQYIVVCDECYRQYLQRIVEERRRLDDQAEKMLDQILGIKEEKQP